jgi:hypothetical protein
MRFDGRIDHCDSSFLVGDAPSYGNSGAAVGTDFFNDCCSFFWVAVVIDCDSMTVCC